MSISFECATRFNRKFTLTAAACLCLIIYLFFGLENVSPRDHHPVEADIRLQPSCKDLPGADETHVVMKTGSTEIRDKLPMHIDTTLQCYPHYVIFSDLSENFQGETVIDVLEDVDHTYKETHDNFQLYRRLKTEGRDSLQSSERSGPLSYSQGGGGISANPGWKLDKWKFLPMMHKTLDMYPDKKWYVFVETDTFIFWKTTLAYTAALNWTRPYYLGAQINIGDITFAQGGSGHLVSRPAVELVVKHYIEHKHELEEFTRGHWAGDCVLGKAFGDAGVALTRAWPIFQGEGIGNMNYGRTDSSHRQWCHPTASYHHMNPWVVEETWKFEQGWLLDNGKSASSFLTHRDVFVMYILPRVMRPRQDWNNHCEDDRGPVSSADECREVCLAVTKCLQYSLDRDRRCHTTSRPNLDEATTGFEAAWIYARMQDFWLGEDGCLYESWLS